MGKKKARSQPSPPGRGSLAAQKRRILGSRDWAMSGLDFCILHGPWREWEDRLLVELARSLASECNTAVTYSLKVLRRPWPELEVLLVGGMRGTDLIQLNAYVVKAFVRYARYHNRSSTLELEILAQGFPAAAFAYAAYGTRRRWKDAERLILSTATLTSPALGTGMGDILDVSQWVPSWESQVVTYARLFLPSGWPALEKKMAKGKCHPRVAYEYAVNVLQGPLPSQVESALTLQSFGDTGKDLISRYFVFAATKKSPSPPSTSSPPP